MRHHKTIHPANIVVHCRCAAGLAKELAKLKISSRLTEQEEQSEDRSRSQSQSQAQSASKKCSAPVKLVK